MTTTVDYTTLASQEQVFEVAETIRARGINVEIVNSAAEALDKVTALIPDGATLMTGSSLTLQQIGFESKLIEKDHSWVNLKDEILAEKDPAVQRDLRLKSTMAQYYLGSVQAITQAGELVVASGSGSQIPSYVFTSPNVIWVAGVQKIVPTLEDALRRLREHNLPHENKRLQALYGMDGAITKILIINQEAPKAMGGRNATLILVNEAVGI